MPGTVLYHPPFPQDFVLARVPSFPLDIPHELLSLGGKVPGPFPGVGTSSITFFIFSF